MNQVDELLITTKEAAEKAEVSYRQADYWLRTGCITIAGTATPGSGKPRYWSDEDIAVLRVLGRVSAAFNGKLDRSVLTAAGWATRVLISNDWLGDPVEIELSEDVRLVVETSDWGED